MKYSYIPLIAVFLIIIGCATTGSKKPVYSPVFDYTPLAIEGVDKIDLTFGIVDANYSDSENWANNFVLIDFAKSMAADFQELLSARGYNLSGPFNSINEMTYLDKERCDLLLTPDIDISVVTSPNQFKEVIMLFGPNLYQFDGTSVISGRVNLSIRESLTNEKMWIKSIELPRTTVSWKGQTRYKEVPSSIDLSDPGISQAVGPELEKFYKKVLETAWNHLDPKEMAHIQTKSKDLRAKKVY